jgi:hypothetical protein
MCSPSEKLIGGGYKYTGDTSIQTWVTQNSPEKITDEDSYRWQVVFSQPAPGSKATVYAICAMLPIEPLPSESN